MRSSKRKDGIPKLLRGLFPKALGKPLSQMQHEIINCNVLFDMPHDLT